MFHQAAAHFPRLAGARLRLEPWISFKTWAAPAAAGGARVRRLVPRALCGQAPQTHT